jgi:S-adenosylmethionine/arginine decarboxylase-like enzyme
MSEPLKSVHVRLSPEAHRVLVAVGEADDKDAAEMARLILEEALLGRVHVLMLTAKRYQGMGFSGILRDLEGLPGKGGK